MKNKIVNSIFIIRSYLSLVAMAAQRAMSAARLTRNARMMIQSGKIGKLVTLTEFVPQLNELNRYV